MIDSKQEFNDELVKSWGEYARMFIWKLSLERGRLLQSSKIFQTMIDDGTLSKDSEYALQMLVINSHKLEPKSASDLAEEVTQLFRDALVELVKPLLSKDDPWDKLPEKAKTELSDGVFFASTGVNPGYFRVLLESLLINGDRV